MKKYPASTFQAKTKAELLDVIWINLDPQLNPTLPRFLMQTNAIRATCTGLLITYFSHWVFFCCSSAASDGWKWEFHKFDIKAIATPTRTMSCCCHCCCSCTTSKRAKSSATIINIVLKPTKCDQEGKGRRKNFPNSQQQWWCCAQQQQHLSSQHSPGYQ